MAISHIHTFLVRPGKGEREVKLIGGAPVKLEGKLFNLLEGIYLKSDVECDIEISFNEGDDGKKENVCRSLIVDYLDQPTLPKGRKIAERLQSVSDGRTGLGLLFLISGKESHDHKLVVSRFPTDSAILAEEDDRNLTVEFLERVFMKSATAYKAAAYQDRSLAAGFWAGRAVDRQINSRTVQLSDYWIAEFLASGFKLTAAAGTRRLGVALRQAARHTDDTNVKSEITSAVTLANALTGKQISIVDFENQFGLSAKAREAIERELRNPALKEERFRFDATEFKSQVGFRAVQLNNGAMLTAESAQFDEVWEREVVNQEKREVRFSTTGTVVDEKLRKGEDA